MKENKPKKNSWFGKIETKEESLKVIKDVSNAFYAVAALEIIVGFFLNIGMMIDGVMLAILALLLRKLNSRTVAVIALLVTLIGVIFTGYNKYGGGEGGSNTFLAIIIFWASVRAVQATFKFHRK